MKHYVFTCQFNRSQKKDYKIKASGMLDAMRQVSKIKHALEHEADSKVEFVLKEIIYRNSKQTV